MDEYLTETAVVFRKFQGEIVALFPFESANLNLDNCCCYSHIGQHSAANYNMVIAESVAVDKPEYQPLLDELISIGYSPTVLTEPPVNSRFARALQLHKLMHQ